MPGKLKVAVLGLGHWYSAYGLGRALRESSKAELVAVSHAHQPHLDEFTRTFGIKGYRTAEDLLAREHVDIVQIASPVSEIRDLTVLAASKGKHMILGKPMAMTVAEAKDMVAAVEKAGVLCLPFQCHIRLRYPDLKAQIDRGEIGKILLLHQTSRWSIAEDWMNSGTPGWFADPRHVPGGALIDEGIYWVDFFRWITGSEIVDVEARVANILHPGLQVEDWGLATFTLANGVIATLEGAWTIVSPRVTAPSPKMNAVVRIEIVGDRGEIADQFFRVPGRSVLAAGAKDWVFERQMDLGPAPFDHLLDCLEKGVQTIGTIEDAYRSFVPAMAAYDAAKTGTRITINS